MNDEITVILGNCLDAVEAGTLTPLDCLEQHPDHKDELIPLLEGAHYIKTWASAKPAVTFQAVARQRLLRKLPPRTTQIIPELTWQEKLQSWIEAAFGWLKQPARRTAFATSFAALVCLVGLTTLYSNQALPGEPLYPLKTTVEQVWLDVNGEVRQQELQVEYSQRRLTEIESLLVAGKTETAVLAAQTRLPEANISSESVYLHLADEHLRLAAEQAGQGNVETASANVASYARNMAAVLTTFEETAPESDPTARLATLELSLETQALLIEEGGLVADEALVTEARTVLAEATMFVENGFPTVDVEPEPMPLSDTPIITPTVTITATALPTTTQPIGSTLTPEVTPEAVTDAPEATASPAAAGTDEPEETSAPPDDAVDEEETPSSEEPEEDEDELVEEPAPTAEPPIGSPVPVGQEDG